MQAMLMMAFFGMVFALLAAIVNVNSQTATLRKQEQVQAVQQMFNDVEFAINTQIIGNYGDLSCCGFLRGAGGVSGNETALVDTGNPDPGLLSTLVPWSVNELQLDPWYKPVQVISRVVDRSTDYIQVIDAGVEAPVRAFALISSGPDRKLSAALNAELAAIAAMNDYNAYRAILALEQLSQNQSDSPDDIVKAFSTRDAMQNVWNIAKTAHSNFVNVSKAYYRQEYEEFLPQIQAVLTQQIKNGSVFNNNGSTTLDVADMTAQVNAWRTNPTLLANANYPGFPRASGLEVLERMGISVQKSLPLFADLLVVEKQDEGSCGGNATCIANSRQIFTMRFEKTPGNADDWNINYVNDGYIDARVVVVE